MKLLKNGLMITTILLLTGQPSFADCQSDCKAALNSADKLIQDLKDEVSIQKQLVANQNKQVSALTVQNNEKADELTSAWHNPIYMTLLGVVLGGTAVYLVKR